MSTDRQLLLPPGVREHVDDWSHQRFLFCDDPKFLPGFLEAIPDEKVRRDSVPVVLEAMRLRIERLEQVTRELMHMYRAKALQDGDQGRAGAAVADSFEARLVAYGQRVGVRL